MRLARLLRTTLARRLRERGYAVRWLPPAVMARDRMIEVSFGMLAAHLMLTVPRPYFIGIGANDGVTHDPLHPFVRDHGWRGAMVEPMPEAFAALQRNYAGFPDVQLVPAAIGAADGTATMYAVEVTDPHSLHLTLHASFDRDVLLRAQQWHDGIEGRIVERQVRVLGFATLLAQLGNPTVDVLKIDTEGHDLEILSSIDLARLRPRLILAEQANLPRAGKERMAEMMLDAGYRVGMTNLDMLGYLPTGTD